VGSCHRDHRRLRDKYPVTGFGQGVAVVMMIFGVGLIGVLTATVASYFVGQDLGRLRRRETRCKPNFGAPRNERCSPRG